jgi:hypothetical protein
LQAAHRWGERCGELGPPFDVIVACETLYWGGWDLLCDDTRDAQLVRALALLAHPRHTVSPSPSRRTVSPSPSRHSPAGSSSPPPQATLLQCSAQHTLVLVGFTVRDRCRELGFLDTCARHFRCRLAQSMQGTLESAAEGDVVLVVLERLEES